MKVAIITGGASGIGRAVAGVLTARGDHVILADIGDATSTAEALTFAGPGTAEAAVLDVRDAAGFAQLVDRVVAEHGRLDLLFNNAGIGVGGPTEHLTVAHWDRVIDVNLRGVTNGIAAAYPGMVERRSGHIVNTASLAGLVPAPILAPYAATKHAVVGLSLSLRPEAAGHGVNVTVVCPGFTDTPILDSAGPADLPQTSEAGAVRGMAAALPGGLYDVDLLARDIVRGVDRNEAIVVAPRSARLMWWAMRVSPGRVLRTAQAQAEAARRRLSLRPKPPTADSPAR